MKKLLRIALAMVLASGLCLSTGAAAPASARAGVGGAIQVGLAYSSGALTAANLENNSGYGAGYRLGYFDDALNFVELGRTGADTTKLTVLRTCEIYYNSAGYTDQVPSGDYKTIGCYHVVLDSYDTYQAALADSANHPGSFVAWISGQYQLRQGAYATKEEAVAAMETLGGLEVKGTSAYAVNVVSTGSTKILFQFDGGSSTPFGVMPDVTGKSEVRTWFKGFRYQGGFRYERIGGGKLTVVNIVDLETYIKGVIPYEMNNAWPLEALKAQAVCARSYGYNKLQEHSHGASNFDICTTEHCQVYRGVGSGVSNYQANERTDRAVEETSGMYALYDGKPIWAYYSSSHGGASEQIDLVWSSDFKKFPYIAGVVDPYEQEVAHLNSYSYWMKTWTKDELTKRLRARGYAVNTRVDSLDLTYSERGNVIRVRVNYENGKYNDFTPKMDFGVRSLFGVSSLHFTINGQGAQAGAAQSSGQVMVNQTQTVDSTQPLYVLSGAGESSRLDAESLYVITAGGTVSQLLTEDGAQSKPNSTTPAGTVVHVTGSRFVVEGAGNGHQLGMSQYGAYAMAEQGFTYDEIIKFYYTGVRVDGL